MKFPRTRAFAVAPLLAAALFLGAAPTAGAQCFGPDGLDLGPCCAPVPANLPQFPNVVMPGVAACWDQCTPTVKRALRVQWTTPVPVTCGQYSTQLTAIDDITGLPMLGGQMLLDYTRTWTEIDPTGNAMQVWRFTAKVDLAALSTALAAACPVPSCIAPAGPHPTAFFYGYVDYASCNAAAGWQNVIVLQHAADRFIHTPGLSDRPGVFHPARSYAIVAPDSPLQPFVLGNAIASGGPLQGEATRDVTVLGVPPMFCMVEDKVAAGALTPLGAACLDTLAANPKRQTLRQFQGQTSCVNSSGVPGAWTSLNINFPVLPWFHMVTTSVGGWTNPNAYPGIESAWVDEGLFVHQNACSGDVVELKYGATTRNGWTAMLSTGIIAKNFTDIADNYTAPLFGPYALPIMGSVRKTDRLIYVNVP